mmetsp:Transcript_17275/g.30993  ORF Transcript_17275/g.30993 Transcript_17275/m.30993 type:complete len:105 (+) Transcript_17275:226-540(+)
MPEWDTGLSEYMQYQPVEEAPTGVYPSIVPMKSVGPTEDMVVSPPAYNAFAVTSPENWMPNIEDEQKLESGVQNTGKVQKGYSAFSLGEYLPKGQNKSKNMLIG